MRPCIAIFDHRVTPTNPIGSCHRRLLAALCQEYDFTVFAIEFDNPCPARIKFVRIPAPLRPQCLLFLVYYSLAPLYYLVYRFIKGVRFDLIQLVEGNLSFGQLSYSHFCHRTYLKQHWPQARLTGVRGFVRWLDHWLRARLEPFVYSQVEQIVVPSQGLACELSAEYPITRSKIQVLPNPVELERMRQPAEFDRAQFRQRLGVAADERMLVFVALGQFERKGLPLVLEAMAQLKHPKLKLVVVGGPRDLIAAYQARTQKLGLAAQVSFVGLQADVRPYLWAADAFTLPSLYEVFPLVVLEAAAAGRVILVTPLNGVEEFLQDGVNGLLLAPTVAGLVQGLTRWLQLSPEMQAKVSAAAQRDVAQYRTSQFITNWRNLYQAIVKRKTVYATSALSQGASFTIDA